MENQGGAEVRRIHVIYFLSRKGKIEHPHLVRVHHLSRNGVHLRDVKRWLGELRGKDMPESFAWSYKRRYKSGYVWQDLLDEDLITPISDNEYVLKGSEIPSTFGKEDSYTEKNSPSHDEKSTEEEPDDSPKSPLNKEDLSQFHHQENAKMEEQSKSHCEIEQETHSFGSEISISSNTSMIKVEDEKHSRSQESKDSRSPTEEIKQEIREENNKLEDSSSSSSPSKKKNRNTDNVANELKNETPRSCSSASRSTFSRSKSYTNGASHLFRNLMTCGTVDTRDSATVSINRRNKPSMDTKMSYDHHTFEHNSFDRSLELCKGDKLGGSQRVFGTPWNQQPQHARRSYDGVRSSSKSKSESASPKPSAAYKPINGPQCSHCGKQFKPEKLHAHMKSCKGLKAFTKSNSSVSAATTQKSDRSAELPVDNYSISGYYLTQRR